MFPALKRALTPTSLMGQSQRSEIDSYADSYFREIGFKIGENSMVGSTESPDQDGSELLEDVELDLPQDNYMTSDVERAVVDEYGRRANINPSSNGMTMAAAYSSNLHTYFHDTNPHPGVSPQHSDDAYAITLRKNASDDVTISTLGEESIKRRQSPLYAQQQLPDKQHQKTFFKATQRQKLDEMDLKESTTGSTLEERPSDDSSDHKSSSRHSQISTPSNIQFAKKRWGLIYFTFGASLIFLGAASVVIGICMMQLKADQSADVVPQDASTWQPRLPEDWIGLPTDDSIPEGLELARQDLLQIISIASPNSLTPIGIVDSPQYQAFEWMIQNADYLQYSIERVLQRWSMAVLYFSLGGGSWPLVDAHECLWHSSEEQNVCDDQGRITVFHLSKSGLSGTIPPELSLLGTSLERLYLPYNNITGTIPSEIGYLTKLVRLELTSNQIKGTIPSELAQLSNLVLLGLGQNQVSGRIPGILGELKQLSTLGLEGNDLKGTIPSEIGEMVSLEVLTMEANQLQGTVPSELGLLQNLDILSIHHNKFVGSIPEEICLVYDKNPDMALVADCSEVTCKCCTICCSGCEGDAAGVLEEQSFSQTAAPSTNSTYLPSLGPELFEDGDWNGTQTTSPSLVDFFDDDDTNTTAGMDSPLFSEFFDEEDTNTTLVPSTVLDSNNSTFDPLGPITEETKDLGRIAAPTTLDAPSSAPSLQFQSTCEPSITLAKACYERDEDSIQVEFQNCDATDNDWIGLFQEEDIEKDPVGKDSPPSDTAELWIRPCGNTTCSTPVVDGAVSLGRARTKEGKYLAVLVRQEIAIATSERVEVRRKCKESP